ncbi:MAG: tetratricopeptide repeat-containing sensor histidine kinase [Prolixibacteraceae bacterium]|nr:tetratricopeptide repeat-containing sensor histidine kinase [Prolixibacteraceae bacterium]
MNRSFVKSLFLTFFLFTLMSVVCSADLSDQKKQDNSVGSIIEKATKLVNLATNHDSVQSLLNTADELAKSSDNRHQLNQIVILRGLNEYYSGNYEDAIDLYYKALDLCEQTNDSLLIAKVNHNLGMIYDELEDYDEAISYFNKSLEFSQAIRDSALIAKSFQNIAISFQNKKDLEKAIQYNQMADQIARMKKDTVMIIDVINNLGTIAYDQKKFDESLANYEKALDLYIKVKDRQGMALAYNNIGLVYLEKKDYKRALSYFNQSLELANELKMTDFIGLVYGNLTVYYEELKDYKNAYYYYDKYNILNDSLSGEKKSKMIRQIQARFQLKKNTRELEELKQNNQSQIKAIKTAKLIQVYLVIITLLVVLFMAATFYLLVKEKRLARELHVKTDQLKELNVSKDKFFSIIAHDLKNPFNVLVGYTSILKADLEVFTREELQQIISDLNQAAENGFDLLQNLLVWSRTQTNQIHTLKTPFKLLEVFEQVKALVDLNLISKQQQLLADIDPQLVVFADKEMISTVLRNLIFNAIKFSPKNSKIEVISSLEGDTAQIRVIDYGIGIAPELIVNLFEIGKNTTYPGTEGESGTGLGLAICREFVEKNDGKIWIESKLGEGSVFYFTIPVQKTVQPA